MLIFKTANPEVNFDFSDATSFQIFESNAESTTTSAYPTYVVKLSGTTSTASTGKFILCWYFEFTNSAANTSNWVKVDYKATTAGSYTVLSECQLRVPQSNNYLPVSGFRIFEMLTSDTIDFRISYCRVSSTAKIRNVNVYIFKVAQ